MVSVCAGVYTQSAHSDEVDADHPEYLVQISALESVPFGFWDCLINTEAADCAPSSGASHTRREPFAVAPEQGSTAELAAKWADASERIAADIQSVRECRVQASNCNSKAARNLIAIVDSAEKEQGFARLGTANQAVNLAIRAVSDMAQYGVSDYWASPLESIGHRAGDCEDYAIAKYAALRLLGIPEEDMRLVVVRNLWQRENHAVLAVFFDGKWRLLDNLTMVMADPSRLARYEPLFSFGRNSGAMIAYRYERGQAASTKMASR